MNQPLELAKAFGLGAGIATVLAYPTFQLLKWMKAKQTVSQYVAEHAHKQGTPTMGGLMILLGFLGYVLATGADWRILAFTIAFSFIGFFDDYVVPRMFPGKRGLGWGQKLVLQFAVAIGSMYLLSDGQPVTIAVGTFALLFFSNAYNFADGLDWLAGTLLFAYAGALFILLPQGKMTSDLAGLLGASIPFMVLNRPKAKIFMGDVGSMFIGAWLGIATLSIFGTQFVSNFDGAFSMGIHYSQPLLAVLVLSVVMAVELIPVPLQILSVKLRGKRMFPMTPIHHAFQKAGWKETRIVALFFGVQIVCSVIAILLASPIYWVAEK